MAGMLTSISQRSVRTLLLWLVLACLLPGVTGASLMFIHEYRQGRAEQERSMVLTARALVAAVDNQLRRSQSVAQALATRDSLLARDFAGFHRGAREALGQAGMGTNVVLRDENGRQVLNTATDFGAPLPVQPLPQALRTVFETGRPTVSDLFVGLPLRRKIMSVNVPVTIDGRIAYVLGIGILPEQFSALLQAQKLPDGWVAAVLDAGGTVVGRNITPERLDRKSVV